MNVKVNAAKSELRECNEIKLLRNAWDTLENHFEADYYLLVLRKGRHSLANAVFSFHFHHPITPIRPC